MMALLLKNTLGMLFSPRRVAGRDWASELVFRTTKAMFKDNEKLGLQQARQRIDSASVKHPAQRKVESIDRELHNITCTMVSPKAAAYETNPKSLLIVYLHGGGYVLGSPRSHAALLAQLAVNSNCTVIAPDYRLAPEHPFPVPQQDCLEIVKTVLKTYSEHRIVLAGDSAGGGLAISVALALKELNQLDQIDSLVLLSPWIDPSAKDGSMLSNQDSDYIDITFLNECVEALMQGGPADDPGICYANADLAGLPRMLVQYGSAEVFCDQIEAFCQHAKQSGIDVTQENYSGQFHVFHIGSAVMRDAKRAMKKIALFIN